MKLDHLLGTAKRTLLGSLIACTAIVAAGIMQPAVASPVALSPVEVLQPAVPPPCVANNGEMCCWISGIWYCGPVKGG